MADREKLVVVFEADAAPAAGGPALDRHLDTYWSTRVRNALKLEAHYYNPTIEIVHVEITKPKEKPYRGRIVDWEEVNIDPSWDWEDGEEKAPGLGYRIKGQLLDGANAGPITTSFVVGEEWFDGEQVITTNNSRYTLMPDLHEPIVEDTVEVWLKAHSDSLLKIKAIRAVRQHTRFGLKKAKDTVEGALRFKIPRNSVAAMNAALLDTGYDLREEF